MTTSSRIIIESLGGPAAIAVEGLVLLLPDHHDDPCSCAILAESLRDTAALDRLSRKLDNGG